MLVKRWPDLGDNDGHDETISSSRCRSVIANAGQGPIKCLHGNLGRKEVCHTKEEEKVDDCQEDQDVVLGLCTSLIYSLERALKCLLKRYMKPVILGYGS